LNVLEESISDEIQVTFVGLVDGRREELCSTQLKWKHCLSAPNDWAINNKFSFKSKQTSEEMLDSRVQIKWIDTTSDESKTSDIDDYYLKPQFRATQKDSGYLEVILAAVMCNELKNEKNMSV
jgi:hypothetical protein